MMMRNVMMLNSFAVMNCQVLTWNGASRGMSHENEQIEKHVHRNHFPHLTIPHLLTSVDHHVVDERVWSKWFFDRN